MTERIILTGVAWADIVLTWLWRIVAAGLAVAGVAGLAAMIWGIRHHR